MSKSVPTLLTILFWYLILSFISRNWNPIEWDFELMAIGAILYILINYFHK